jgi:hypothetical protein
MHAREELRLMMQSLIAAIATEAILFLGCYLWPGGNAQGILVPSAIQWIYLSTHLIGSAIADKVGCDMIVPVSGVVQFFVIIYIGQVLRDSMKQRHST